VSEAGNAHSDSTQKRSAWRSNSFADEQSALVSSDSILTTKP
jgi:hypothetical protein